MLAAALCGAIACSVLIVRAGSTLPPPHDGSDARSAKAYLALGLRLGGKPRYAERERYLREAIALDPASLDAQTAYLQLLGEVGRLREADDVFASHEGGFDARAGALPQLAVLSAMRGDLSRSYQILHRLELVDRDEAPAVRWTVAVWWDGAARMNSQRWRRLLSDEPEAQAACLEGYFAAIGTRAKARGLPQACDVVEQEWRVRLLAREGDIDGAYELMSRDLPTMTMFLFYPEMKAVRADPRFMALAERLGLLAYWRETNAWPDFCSDEDLPYACR